jgi:hypothetical protein
VRENETDVSCYDRNYIYSCFVFTFLLNDLPMFRNHPRSRGQGIRRLVQSQAPLFREAGKKRICIVSTQVTTLQPHITPERLTNRSTKVLHVRTRNVSRAASFCIPKTSLSWDPPRAPLVSDPSYDKDDEEAKPPWFVRDARLFIFSIFLMLWCGACRALVFVFWKERPLTIQYWYQVATTYHYQGDIPLDHS